MDTSGLGCGRQDTPAICRSTGVRHVLITIVKHKSAKDTCTLHTIQNGVINITFPKSADVSERKTHASDSLKNRTAPHHHWCFFRPFPVSIAECLASHYRLVSAVGVVNACDVLWFHSDGEQFGRLLYRLDTQCLMPLSSSSMPLLLRYSSLSVFAPFMKLLASVTRWFMMRRSQSASSEIVTRVYLTLSLDGAGP